MFKPVEVKPLANYRLWLKYADGVSGEIDLTHLAGKGVFSIWNNYDIFKQVYIGRSGQIAWNEDIDICPDALYLQITHQKPEELFPNLQKELVYA